MKTWSEGEAVVVDEVEPATATVYELDPAPRQPVVNEGAAGEVVSLYAAPPSAPMVEAVALPPVAAVPPSATEEEVPEAGFVWVEDEPELYAGRGHPDRSVCL